MVQHAKKGNCFPKKSFASTPIRVHISKSNLSPINHISKAVGTSKKNTQHTNIQAKAG